MLERKVYRFLLDWKGRRHKSLVIWGQRQVGKTFIVEEFGKTYDSYLRIPLDRETYRSIFKGKGSLDEVLTDIGGRFGEVDLVPGRTLIFLDEVQSCREAYSFLKDFTIDGRFDVVASGSLLGVKNRGRRRGGADGEPVPLNPVGYVETYEMRSLDFEEFLWAAGTSRESIEVVRRSVRDRAPLSDTFLEVFGRMFRHFMVVGGMPEAVQRFVDTRSYAEAGAVLSSVIDSCRDDVTKYSEGVDGIKTLKCFDSIPAQLSGTNKRFMYSRVEPGSRSRGSAEKFADNLLWIEYAGYGNFVHAVSQIALPLQRNSVADLFKVYMSDTGILVHMGDDSADVVDALVRGDYSFNMGEVAENAVAECLVKCGLRPYYYRKTNGGGRMELDFVFERGGRIVVVEVKSGRSRDSPSLDVVDSRFRVDRKVMLDGGNIRTGPDGVEHYPLFAAAFLDGLEPEPEQGEADLSTLRRGPGLTG